MSRYVAVAEPRAVVEQWVIMETTADGAKLVAPIDAMSVTGLLNHIESLQTENARLEVRTDAIVQLLHLVDGQLGLAVHRGEGNTDRWRKEGSDLITKVRQQIEALSGGPS